MYTHIFKTAVIDYYVSHRYIEPVTHPLSFPCQGQNSLPFRKGIWLSISKGHYNTLINFNKFIEIVKNVTIL